MAIKHPQWILSVMREALTNLNFGTKNFSSYNFDEFVAAIEPYCVFRQRNALEKDANFPQLLPYAVPRQKTPDGGWKYFPARRNHTGGEPKLWDLITIAYAGHIDLADAAYKQTGNQDVDMSTVDIKETIIHATYRELCEELLVEDIHGREIDLRDMINFTNNYINDDTVPVNTFHLAIMVTIDIPEDATVKVRERESLDSMGKMEGWQLMEIFDQLESWTSIFVQSLFETDTKIVDSMAAISSFSKKMAELKSDMVAIPLLTDEEVANLTKYKTLVTETLTCVFQPMLQHAPAAAEQANRVIEQIRDAYVNKWIESRGKNMPEPLSLANRGQLFAKSQEH